MRILITGFVMFVAWCFISAWLYNDKLLPALKKPVPEKTIPEPQTAEADSLMKLKASIPKSIMIYFGFDKAEFKIDPETDRNITGFKEWLDKYAGSSLTITGNTDLVGTGEYNMALGLKRAEVVGKFLKTKGFDSTRIITQSLGENNPSSDYLTEAGRALNRRTEISIKMK